MPSPLLFIGLPLLLALAAYLLSARWSRLDPQARFNRFLAPSAALAAGALGVLAASLPLDQPMFGGRLTISSTFAVLGRTFAIDPAGRVSVALLFGQGALLLLAVGFAGAGRLYVPAALAALGLLAAALFVRPFIFAALFLEMAAVFAVLMLADETHRERRGAWRFLVFMTLAMPFILVSGWLLESSATSPETAPPTFNAALMLGLGFAILLAVVPFQSWVPLVAESAPPLASAFVFVVMQQAVVFLMLVSLAAYPWLEQNPVVYRTLTVMGGAMVLVGGVFALGQRNFGRTLGYAMLVDIGAVLLGVGLGSEAGVSAALTALVLRGAALTLWGMGCEQLRRVAGGDDFDSLRGMAWRHPFASAAMVFGLLSLVGFPLTAGFPGRWALLRLLAQLHPTGAILLLLGLASVSLVCVRGLAALLSPPKGEPAPALPESIREKPVAMVIYGLGVALVLAGGAFPQWLLPLAAGAAAVFTKGGP
jgi:NADH-quinone oxidoreductase subunit N